MPSVVGKRGQIVIEKPIRDALGLAPGYIAVQRLEGDHVVLTFFPPEHGESLRGVLEDLTKRSISPVDWSGAREEAWSKAVREDHTQGEDPKDDVQGEDPEDDAQGGDPEDDVQGEDPRE